MAPRRLSLGYQWGYIGNPKGFLRDEAVNYHDDEKSYEANIPYLNGFWKVTKEYVENTEESKHAYVAINFQGSRILIEGDGRFALYSGDKPPQEFELFLEKAREFVESPVLLKLVPRQKGARLYVFTFDGGAQ